MTIELDFDETHVSQSGYKVKILTLDSLELSRIDLLKIDVEGFENEVLIGAENTLDRTNKVIIEVHERNRNFVNTKLQEHGLYKL
uniref:Methyltransferase FkbM domain-containing protein n=1 Tax=Saccharolobus solfataricus (strain 98/2) TaxID=555311 RepID=D0KNJ2_SACS9